MSDKPGLVRRFFAVFWNILTRLRLMLSAKTPKPQYIFRKRNKINHNLYFFEMKNKDK